MKKIIFAAILITTLSGFAYATTTITKTTNLMVVYRQALVSDQTFQSAMATYMAATEAYPQARAVLLPFVNLTGVADYTRLDILRAAPPFGPSTNRFRSYEYTLNINQPVIDFTKWSTLHVAKYQVKQASAIFAAAAQNLLLRVAQAYFDVLNAEDVLRFTEAEKRATGRQLDQAQQRFKVGLDAITSVYDAQASYDAVVARAIAAKNDVANRKEQLREITGVTYKNLAKLKKQMPLLTPKPNDVEAWVNKADQYNFTLQAARFSVNAARAAIKVTFGGHLPTLDAVGSYEREHTSGIAPGTPGFRDTKLGILGLQLTVPIFQGGLINSQVRQAQAEFKNAMAQMENAHREVSVELHQTYNSIISGISKIKADKQAVLSRESSANSTEAALKVGTRTIVDLLLAQQQLFQAQTQLATDQFLYINNTLKFKELAGTLTVKDLQAINSWLKGTGHKQSPYNLYHGDAAAKNSAHKKLIVKNNSQKPYAIQLAAYPDRPPLEKFIKKNKLNTRTSIYTTKIKNKRWYVLLYGNYNSFAQAKKSLKKLPKDLQQLHPWIRHISKAKV